MFKYFPSADMTSRKYLIVVYCNEPGVVTVLDTHTMQKEYSVGLNNVFLGIKKNLFPEVLSDKS